MEREAEGRRAKKREWGVGMGKGSAGIMLALNQVDHRGKGSLTSANLLSVMHQCCQETEKKTPSQQSEREVARCHSFGKEFLVPLSSPPASDYQLATYLHVRNG